MRSWLPDGKLMADKSTSVRQVEGAHSHEPLSGSFSSFDQLETKDV